jgi:hypothetical protein
MGGRAVYCTGLENRRRRKASVGSNPSPSANCPLTPENSEDFFRVAQKAAHSLLNIFGSARYLLVNVRHVLLDSLQSGFP